MELRKKEPLSPMGSSPWKRGAVRGASSKVSALIRLAASRWHILRKREIPSSVQTQIFSAARDRAHKDRHFIDSSALSIHHHTIVAARCVEPHLGVVIKTTEITYKWIKLARQGVLSHGFKPSELSKRAWTFRQQIQPTPSIWILLTRGVRREYIFNNRKKPNLSRDRD